MLVLVASAPVRFQAVLVLVVSAPVRFQAVLVLVASAPETFQAVLVLVASAPVTFAERVVHHPLPHAAIEEKHQAHGRNPFLQSSGPGRNRSVRPRESQLI